jgi:hypothetical protein
MKWLCFVSIFLIAVAAAGAEAPDFLQDPLPSRYKLRAHFKGGEASATKDGPTVVSTPPFFVFDTVVSVLEPARTGRVWILHTDDRLTIALWVDHEALATVATKELFLPARADRDDTGVWLKKGCPLTIEGRRAMVDDGVVEVSVVTTPNIAGKFYEPSPPDGNVLVERVGVYAETSLLDAPGGVRFGKIRKDAVVQRLGEVEGDVLVAYANDDVRVVGWISVAAVRSRTEPGRESSSMYGNDLMFVGRAIPAGTFVHDAPNGSPIGFSRGWIPVVVQQARDGWSEVTLGAEIPARVWVRDEQISHLR